jgi:AhpD family alkylhydroperoxidase
MTARTMNANDLFAAAPELMKKWTATSLAIASSLEPALIRLVEIRASQINGCANCINMHAAEAREKGETEQRSTCCRPGARPLAIPTANAPRSAGPTR